MIHLNIVDDRTGNTITEEIYQVRFAEVEFDGLVMIADENACDCNEYFTTKHMSEETSDELVALIKRFFAGEEFPEKDQEKEDWCDALTKTNNRLGDELQRLRDALKQETEEKTKLQESYNDLMKKLEEKQETIDNMVAGAAPSETWLVTEPESETEEPDTQNAMYNSSKGIDKDALIRFYNAGLNNRELAIKFERSTKVIGTVLSHLRKQGKIK